MKPTPIIDIAATRLPGGTPTPTGKRIPAWQRDCENLWASYSAKRDKIVHWHQRCLASGERSPKLVFVFSTNPREPWRKYKPPGHHWPANRLKWLKSAIKRVDFILANPEGTSFPKSGDLREGSAWHAMACTIENKPFPNNMGDTIR